MYIMVNDYSKFKLGACWAQSTSNYSLPYGKVVKIKVTNNVCVLFNEGEIIYTTGVCEAISVKNDGFILMCAEGSYEFKVHKEPKIELKASKTDGVYKCGPWDFGLEGV